MLFGRYQIEVNEDGKVFVHGRFERHYEVGDTYYVYIDEEDCAENGIFLIYRFDQKVSMGEKLIGTYTVPQDKQLEVPLQYRAEMVGDCYLIGAASAIELHRVEDYDKRMAEVDIATIERLVAEVFE